MFQTPSQPQKAQSQVVQSEPDFDIDTGDDALLAQMAEIQKKLKQRDSIKIKKQMSSSTKKEMNIEHFI